MRLVHADAAGFVALAVDHRDVILRRQHLHREVPEDVRHALGPALIARRRIADARARQLAVLLHNLRGVGLQDGIGVIADQLLKVRDAIGTARRVEHRSRTRSGRLEAGEEGMRPVAGEIGDRRAVLRGAVGRHRQSRRLKHRKKKTPPRHVSCPHVDWDVNPIGGGRTSYGKRSAWTVASGLSPPQPALPPTM